MATATLDSVMKRSFAAGVVAGAVLGGGATALWLGTQGDNASAPAIAYPDAYSVMESIRAGGVPCKTNIIGGKYPPDAFTCSLEGRSVRVISTAQGGPDVMPRGPSLDGPNWSITTPSVGDLVRIQSAVGGQLR